MKRPTRSGLTYRPLPAHDPGIERLSDEERHAVAMLWLGLAGEELESIRAFRWIEEAIAGIGAGPRVVALVQRAAEDEERHGEICRRVASAYRGADLVPRLPARALLPLRTPGDPELELALYLIEASCLGETIGTLFIKESLDAASSPLARAALRELLTDEVEHARLGFAYLAAPYVGARHREAISGWLPRLFQSTLDYWKMPSPRPMPRALAAHGCLSAAQVDSLVWTALREIALPGLAYLGLDTRPTTEYLKDLSADSTTRLPSQ
jgi:hypothetical protein